MIDTDTARWFLVGAALAVLLVGLWRVLARLDAIERQLRRRD